VWSSNQIILLGGFFSINLPRLGDFFSDPIESPNQKSIIFFSISTPKQEKQ